MKKNIIITLDTTRHPEYDHMSSPELCFVTHELPDIGLVESIDKEISRLTSLSYRNKELYMEKTIRVDWGTLAFIVQREKRHAQWLTSNCLGIELKLTGFCRLKLMAPSVHFKTELLMYP